jgi:hypothetical protein
MTEQTENHEYSLFSIISETASSLAGLVFSVTGDQNVRTEDEHSVKINTNDHENPDTTAELITQQDTMLSFVSELVYGPQPKPTNPVLEIVFNQEELAEFDFNNMDDRTLISNSNSPQIQQQPSPDRSIEPPFLLPPILSKLLPYLPPMLQEASSTKLRYCSVAHGISLNTLLRNTEGPELLLARTDNMILIGAFSNDGLQVTRGYVKA